LYKDDRENVRFEHWDPGAIVNIDSAGGAEIFVLEGGFEQGGDKLRQHSWLRMPVNTETIATAGPDGATVWIKTDHLRLMSI